MGHKRRLRPLNAFVKLRKHGTLKNGFEQNIQRKQFDHYGTYACQFCRFGCYITALR